MYWVWTASPSTPNTYVVGQRPTPDYLWVVWRLRRHTTHK